MNRDVRRSGLVLLLLLATASTVSAQRFRDRDDSDDAWLSRCERDRNDNYKSCDVKVSTFDPRGKKITIDPGQNGGAKVQGWDRDEVEVHARLQGQGRTAADADDALRGTRVSIRNGEITVDAPDFGRGQSSSVEFVLYVPRRTDLDIQTNNGPIGIEDVVGDMQLSAQNGPITLRGAGGDVRARARNGPLTVSLTGSRWQGEGLDAETVNGPVTITLPPQYDANLETGTENGPAFVSFPMTVNIQGRLNRNIRATLGRGGPTVRAVTTNGPLMIGRSRS